MKRKIFTFSNVEELEKLLGLLNVERTEEKHPNREEEINPNKDLALDVIRDNIREYYVKLFGKEWENAEIDVEHYDNIDKIEYSISYSDETRYHNWRSAVSINDPIITGSWRKPKINYNEMLEDNINNLQRDIDESIHCYFDNIDKIATKKDSPKNFKKFAIIKLRNYFKKIATDMEKFIIKE